MNKNTMNLPDLIEQLLAFGVINALLDKRDVIFARNQLLDLLQVSEPSAEPYTVYLSHVPETATPILSKLMDAAFDKGVLSNNTLTHRDLFDTKTMGLILVKPSTVIDTFERLEMLDSIQSATDYFYNLCKKCNYIRVDRIAKNIKWSYDSDDFGELEITINLTKPEKDPKEIAALKAAPQSGYPKCLLCPTNIGYAGRLNHPARQTLRTIPVTLANEPWSFQYSPYVYYNEHCIVFKNDHVPMKINKTTFVRLLNFIDRFTHYFVGSNADLPIVGGSILNHEHFQGGSYTFAMAKAPVEYSLSVASNDDIKASIVKWPMSVLRLSSKNQTELVTLADDILTAWRSYSDESVNILAETNGELHNTITPIARMNANGEYEFDLVFRNNRTSTEHPLGIFHPHSEIHHIKKENIGLIEVMGLFILPGRLKTELETINKLLTSETPYVAADIQDESHALYTHAEWIHELVALYGVNNTTDAAQTILAQAVGEKCEQVLRHAGVFKTDATGRDAFNRFLATVNIHR
jgi:UDPglucose--hexose-1-phosphate uridylyltransferase